MNDSGYWISPCSAINHHDGCVSTRSTLGVHNWDDHLVCSSGIKLVLHERGASHTFTRNRLWCRRMPGIHTLDSVHVGMVYEAEGPCLWDRLGKYRYLRSGQPITDSSFRLAREYLESSSHWRSNGFLVTMESKQH